MKRSRKQLRLKGYDYSSAGYYFVTVCTQNRELLFGSVVDGEMCLNMVGEMVGSVWDSLPEHHNVQLDAFQVMPNHIHAVIIIPSVGRGIARNALTFGNVTSGSLPCVVRSLKSECTKIIRRKIGEPKRKIWQRSYYEHSLQKIRQYIALNPKMWDKDENNPENL